MPSGAVSAALGPRAAVYQCNRCKRQVGLTATTVFHWTKLPLTTWCLAIYQAAFGSDTGAATIHYIQNGFAEGRSDVLL